MHLFGDFEAINNRYIVAAAFASADGRYEEHWLMKPYPKFRRLEGYYAQLLPYSDEILASAPLLENCRERFQQVISKADKLWFFDRSDLMFFQESFPNEPQLLLDFSERYADAKALVEEVLTPVYIRNLEDGTAVNIRHFIEYLDQTNINAANENELYEQACAWFYSAHRALQRGGRALHKLLRQLKEEGLISENSEPLTPEKIDEILDRAARSLHPQRLLPRDQIKEMRRLRSRLGFLHTFCKPHPRVVQQLQGNVDNILAAQNERLTTGKLSLSRVEELIRTQNLPLQILELFEVAELDRELCLSFLDRGVGLQTAAALLLDPDTNLPEGEEHNALYDTRLLRLVCLNCFERLNRLKPHLRAAELRATGGDAT